MFGLQVFRLELLVFEDLITEVTSVLLMDLHVPGELAALSCGVATHPAVVGLLPRVGPPVDGQVGDVDEYLPTELTSIPPGDDTTFPPHSWLHERGQSLIVQHHLQSH